MSEFSQPAMRTLIRVGLIAHDEKKDALVRWATHHKGALAKCAITATGTTAGKIQDNLGDLAITALKSGPLGGDQQMGALITQGQLDVLIFFTDPLSPHPHDVDVKALFRLATLYDIPFACSMATANLIFPAFVETHAKCAKD